MVPILVMQLNCSTGFINSVSECKAAAHECHSCMQHLRNRACKHCVVLLGIGSEGAAVQLQPAGQTGW
jgi:hypothetical protein